MCGVLVVVDVLLGCRVGGYYGFLMVLPAECSSFRGAQASLRSMNRRGVALSMLLLPLVSGFLAAAEFAKGFSFWLVDFVAYLLVQCFNCNVVELGSVFKVSFKGRAIKSFGEISELSKFAFPFLVVSNLDVVEVNE